MLTYEQLSKLGPGDKVHWTDPDGGTCSRTYTVRSIGYRIEPGESTLVTIEDEDGGEVEGPAYEFAVVPEVASNGWASITNAPLRQMNARVLADGQLRVCGSRWVDAGTDGEPRLGWVTFEATFTAAELRKLCEMATKEEEGTL